MRQTHQHGQTLALLRPCRSVDSDRGGSSGRRDNRYFSPQVHSECAGYRLGSRVALGDLQRMAHEVSFSTEQFCLGGFGRRLGYPIEFLRLVFGELQRGFDEV